MNKAGDRGSKNFFLNGAATRIIKGSYKLILMAYCEMDKEEVKTHKPKVVVLEAGNNISLVTSYEKYEGFS
ncbi:aspartate 1-decarboxylase [Clostridium sp. YIM B02551]|uniref:aspartate 1-decarboxylase n=1 Tax=Clostridium sp. YIM B02551 TaxID=2910679 RepID=UPI00359FDBA9